MRKIIKIFAAIILMACVVLAVFKFGSMEREYEYERSGNQSNDFSTLELASPYTKNSGDLAAFALHAWENGWGYVWGSFGDVLDSGALANAVARYPSSIGPHLDFIRENWLNFRAADCSGLIKAYGWYEPGIGINYGANGFPDWDANTMFERAQQSGSIDTIPEIPGIAVWCDGHIGIYIGGGIVVEAMGTEYGVVKTELSGYTGSRWTHWLKLEGIIYP